MKVFQKQNFLFLLLDHNEQIRQVLINGLKNELTYQ